MCRLWGALAAVYSRLDDNTGATEAPILRCPSMRPFSGTVAPRSAEESQRAALREEANTAIAAELKKRASDTLDKVLFELSSGMKNAYARSDA